MKKIALDSSLNELFTDALTVQNGSAEPLLASFLFLWGKFRWAWLRNGFTYERVTSTIG